MSFFISKQVLLVANSDSSNSCSLSVSLLVRHTLWHLFATRECLILLNVSLIWEELCLVPVCWNADPRPGGGDGWGGLTHIHTSPWGGDRVTCRYCLCSASCLSSPPWTRRRKLNNWRPSCSRAGIMTDLVISLELVLSSSFGVWSLLSGDNTHTEWEVYIRAYINTQSDFRWVLRIITCSSWDSW